MTNIPEGTKAVLVVWVDSSSVVGDGVWADRDQITPDHLSPEVCETVGWLMHETEEFVTIASSVCEHQVHGHMCIPKIAIRHMLAVQAGETLTPSGTLVQQEEGR